MKKSVNRIIILVIISLLVVPFVGCKTQSDNDAQKDPMDVAEAALGYLEKYNLDKFLELSPYYKSSYIYAELSSLAKACKEEIGNIGNLEFNYYSDVDMDDEVIEEIEAEGCGKIVQARYYSFKNNVTGEWVDIYVGKIDNKWYVWFMEYLADN